MTEEPHVEERPLDIDGASARIVKLVDLAYYELFVSPLHDRNADPTEEDFAGAYRERIIERVISELRLDDAHEDGELVPRKAIAMAVDLTHEDGVRLWQFVRARRIATGNAIHKVNRLIDIADEFYETRDDDRVVELYDEASRLMMTADEAVKLLEDNPYVESLGQSLEAVADVRSLLDELRPEVEEKRSRRREAERQERIAANRKPDVTMDGTRCQCGKPARIDGWCKKCARANGVIVHGKIGGA